MRIDEFSIKQVNDRLSVARVLEPGATYRQAMRFARMRGRVPTYEDVHGLTWYPGWDEVLAKIVGYGGVWVRSELTIMNKRIYPFIRGDYDGDYLGWRMQTMQPISTATPDKHAKFVLWLRR